MVRLGRNTYIEREGDSPFVCDMQTYECSDEERAEAVQVAEGIIRRNNEQARLVAALEQAREALDESGHGLEYAHVLQQVDEALAAVRRER